MCRFWGMMRVRLGAERIFWPVGCGMVEATGLVRADWVYRVAAALAAVLLLVSLV